MNSDYLDTNKPLDISAMGLASIEGEIRAFGGVSAVTRLERINQFSSPSEMNNAIEFLIEQMQMDNQV